MNKYFLIGIPHCGKSTFGRQVADHLQMPFFDTDEMTKSKMGEVRLFDTLSSYFGIRFREEQINAIIELSNLDDSAIIATGAEVALIPKCVQIMKSVGFVIHIRREIEAILNELKDSINSRPVLVEVKKGTILDFRQEAVKSFSEDILQYEAVADFNIDNNGSEDECTERLLTLIQTVIKATAKKQDIE